MSTLTNEQQEVLHSIFTDKDRVVFIKGSAGVGKSYLIQNIYKKAKSIGKSILVTATTNKAKSNLEESLSTTCYTIQSALGYVLNKNYLNTQLVKLNASKYADIIVVDEISMIQKEVLDTLLKSNIKQIILVGDLSQLPAVNSRVDFKSIDCKEFTLTIQQRQTEETLKEIFNNLRKSILGKKLINIQTLKHKDIHLYENHKEFCQAFNNTEGQKRILAYTNKTCDSYNLNINNGVRFKVGDSIILDTKISYFSNGSIVTITAMKELEYYYLLEIEFKTTIRVYKTKASQDRDLLKEYKLGDDEILRQTCSPKHIYSTTIHKAQGITLDNVFIDVSDVYSQLTKRVTRYSKSPPITVNEYQRLIYVAVSRMRKTAHLFIGNKREYKYLKGNK